MSRLTLRLVPCLLVLGAAAPGMAQSSFALLLSGSTAEDRCTEPRGGWLRLTWEGSDPTDGGTFRHKQVGKPKYEDINFRLGPGASSGIFEWFNESFNGQETQKKVVVRGWDPEKKKTIVGSAEACTPSSIVFEGGAMDSDKEAMIEVGLGNFGWKTTGEATQPAPPEAPLARLRDRRVGLSLSGSSENVDQLELQRTSDIRIRKVGVMADGTGRPIFDIDDFTIRVRKVYTTSLVEWYDSYVVKGDQRPENERFIHILYHDDAGKPLLEVKVRIGILRLTDGSGRNRSLALLGPNDVVEAEFMGKKDKNDTDIIIKKF